MIELTEDQWRQVEDGKAIATTDSQMPQSVVVLRKDVYERLHRLIYDDSDWTPEEQLALLAQSGKAAGWDDPPMDVYDNYDEARKKQCP